MSGGGGYYSGPPPPPEYEPPHYHQQHPPPSASAAAAAPFPPQQQQPQHQWYSTQPTMFTPQPLSAEASAVEGGAMTGTLPTQRRAGLGSSFMMPSSSSGGGGASDFFNSGSFSSTPGVGGGGAVPQTRFGLSTLEGEHPLLMELGVDFGKILEKTKSALVPSRAAIDPALMSDGDIAGPFVFCLLLGFLLLLAGKLHFGYVFGFSVAGCWAIYTVLNLVCKSQIELHVVFSVLGYALLPIVLLALVAVFFTLKQQGGVLGMILVPPSVLFSTYTATRFFEATLNAREQRYLIAYPVFLFFACFALITVF